MRQLTINVRNSMVVSVDGLNEGEKFVCVDSLMLDMGIGTEEMFDSLYAKQQISEKCPLVIRSHGTVKETRILDGFEISINQYEKPWTIAEIPKLRR